MALYPKSIPPPPYRCKYPPDLLKSMLIPRLKISDSSSSTHNCFFRFHIVSPQLLLRRETMVTSSSTSTSCSVSTPGNNPNDGAFTTLRERVTFEKEIKKSKFIAIAGPISDKRSAFSFQSEVSVAIPVPRIIVVLTRHFGGIKLGTGGLVRAYGGVASECLRNSPTCVVKSKLQSFQMEDIKQDYETGER